MILHFGFWEPNVSRVIEETLSPGDVFVDVGANIGYHALLASTRVGPTGKVIAIEASTKTFRLLERNLDLNAAKNVQAVKAAVSDQPGRLHLYEFSESNIGAATTLASRKGTLVESVDALPLDEILTTDEIGRLRLLKIDVEGAEPPILRRLVDLLALYPKDFDIIVEATPDDDREAWEDIFHRLLAAGFFAYEIENDYHIEWYLRWRRPDALRRIDAPPIRQQDLFFTRRHVLREEESQ